MRPEPHFFQSFFGPQNEQIKIQVPEYITRNEIVLEIVNNWPLVKSMMNKFNEGKLKQVDQMEQLWFTFITKNNINVNLYENNEDFLKAFWIIPNI